MKLVMNRLAYARASAVAIAAALSAIPFAVAAQGTGDDTQVTRDDSNTIIVTAQFREQSVQDTPLAITAISGEMLEERGQTNVTDIGAFAPNVNLTEANAIQGNAISAFIRGVGQEDSNFALEPGVGVYVDDVYLGTTFGASIDLVDLSRVEVLRGPQGTLAGKNSLGGAIKLYSTPPGDFFEGFAEASYGRFDSIGLRGSLNVPLGEGVATRISANYHRDDGYFEERDYGCANPGQGIAPTGNADANCVLGRAGGKDMLSVRGTLRIAPVGSPLEIDLTGDYNRDRSQPIANKLTFSDSAAMRDYVPGNPFAGVPLDDRFVTPEGTYYNYADYTAEGNYDTVFCAPGGGCFPFQVLPGEFADKPRNDVDGWGLSGRVNFEISDNLSLTSITAYRHAKGESVIDIDGSPLNPLKQRLGYEHEQFTQELRLSGQLGDFADFTIGGFYYDANGIMDFRNQIPIFLYDFETDDRVSNDSLAAFAHLEIHATDRLNLIGGIRYTDDKKTYEFSRRNPDGTVIPLPTSPTDVYLNVLVASLEGLTGVYQGSRLDYRVGVNFEWSDDVMTYAQVSTGYKGGGVNPRPFVADQVTSFDPEDLLTAEVGVKSVLLDGALTFNAAAFYNDYNNIQRTVYLCPDSASLSCAKALNAGDGHSYGAEFEATVSPGGGWLMAGSLSLLDFQYDSINPFTGITLDMDAPFHSDATASGSIQYSADLGSMGTLTPRLDVSYQSSYFYQAINNPPYNLVDGRALVNAALTYETEDGNWQVRARVSNLFDKYYYVIAGENIATLGFANAVVGRPREWSLSVRREF